MSVAENYENFADGGVILWATDLENAPTKFLARVRFEDGSHEWDVAFKDTGGRILIDGRWEQRFEVVGYCRGPDPNSNVAYQLGDPGEGHNAKPGEGTGV